MNRDVKVGDKIAVTMIDGDVVNPAEFRTVVEIDLDRSLMLLDSPVEGSIVVEHDSWRYNDDWVIVDETPTHMQHDEALPTSNSVADKTLEDVKAGDEIVVTRYNGNLCQRGAIVRVVYSDTIGVKFCDGGELAVLYKDPTGMDEWEYASEDYVQHEEETLQHRQAHAYYDDEALSPSYSDAVKAGMTFADYTGVNITEESLDFEPKEEEVLRGITAESLNFEEAPKSDAVNHPSHYGKGRFETIEMIEEITKGYDNGFVAHCVGTAVKYESRAPFKHGSPLTDLRKARKYLDFAIEHLERLEGE